MTRQELSKNEIIKIVSTRFESNPRMLSLFDVNSHGFQKNILNLVEYCYHIVQRLGGVFVASNQKTIIFYYLKSSFSQNFSDYFRYLKIVFTISPKNILTNLKRETLIKKTRLDVSDYIYVWFLAQEKGYGKIDGLIEVQQHLFKLSKEKKLPILLETSNEEVLTLYLRASFKVYHILETKGEKIYFLQADIDTVFKFWEMKKDNEKTNLVKVKIKI